MDLLWTRGTRNAYDKKNCQEDENIKCILDLQNNKFFYLGPRTGYFCKIIKNVNYSYNDNYNNKGAMNKMGTRACVRK